MSSPASRRAAAALSALFVSSGISLASGYSFNIADTPSQCGNLSISISGSGSPPYSVLIVPSGPSPLANNVEVRMIVSKNFSGSDTSISFPLAYPANSQFVAVVSDATGFGSGGTSGAAVVQTSSNSSCFDASKGVEPDFFFNISPNSELTECTATRVWWTESDVQGTPKFYGIIPGGQSFAVPEQNVNTTSTEGQGFSWTPSLRGGTTLFLVGSDNRGIGAGGSGSYTVNANPDNDNSCLSNNSPSSTVGNPAGGAYPTNTDGGTNGGGSTTSSGSGATSSSSSGSGSSSHTNIGAIVGGVVGGVFGLLALCLIGLFFIRRRRSARKNRREGDPVDLLQQNDDTPGGNHALPRWYEPEPFLVPPASTAGESSSVPDGSGPSGGTTTSHGRPSMERLTSTGGPSDTAATSVAGTSTTTRKSPAPPAMRPVNIVQHDDAGTAEAHGEEEPETVELPPAYTNIRK